MIQKEPERIRERTGLHAQMRHTIYEHGCCQRYQVLKLQAKCSSTDVVPMYINAEYTQQPCYKRSQHHSTRVLRSVCVSTLSEQLLPVNSTNSCYAICCICPLYFQSTVRYMWCTFLPIYALGKLQQALHCMPLRYSLSGGSIVSFNHN